MKKAVSVLLIVLFAITLIVALFGCVTQKQRDRICKNCTKESFTKDSIVYKEKLVKIPLYIGDTNQAHIKSPCELLCDKNGNLKDVDTTIKTGKGKSIRIKNKGGKLEITSQIDSLKKIIELKNQIIESYKHEKIIIDPKCELDHVKWYHKAGLWISGISIIFSGFYIFFKIKTSNFFTKNK